MSDKKVHLLMVLTSIFWSGAFITGKIAVGEKQKASMQQAQRAVLKV
ncbi:hypothetical protein [Desulfosporosinus sp. FKA]|nr:hypothetical protein [Desulfosporosinus sp. FKA]